MTKTIVLAGSLVLTLAGMAIAAEEKKAAAAPPEMSPEQKAMMEAYEKMGAVREEHKQLAYFAGNWDAKATFWMDPKADPVTDSAKATVEPRFDGRYLHMVYKGNYQGQPFTGEGLIGFDNLKNKHYVTWIDSMSTGIWVGSGTYDAARKTYTYHGEMPDPMKPSTVVKMRQVSRIVDDKHYVFESYETHDGKEAKTMQIEYSRL
ncbi:DUF1579 domain-containing protein [Tahibacter amnicola]|uniref:DUF1579 domain-containing protein n=1 Tax=Tahibacter amnicola TaxID=2976241 RepID=A0ABY6BLJ7_9GAMM|nr:DUF1579 domain-containing protein [Tahibacter amnicola]UXI68682.1 DUF1579 domain-containing protein [Tahibacter amnicola]